MARYKWGRPKRGYAWRGIVLHSVGAILLDDDGLHLEKGKVDQFKNLKD